MSPCWPACSAPWGLREPAGVRGRHDRRRVGRRGGRRPGRCGRRAYPAAKRTSWPTRSRCWSASSARTRPPASSPASRTRRRDLRPPLTRRQSGGSEAARARPLGPGRPVCERPSTVSASFVRGMSRGSPGRRPSCARARPVSSPTSTTTSCWSSAPWRRGRPHRGQRHDRRRAGQPDGRLHAELHRRRPPRQGGEPPLPAARGAEPARPGHDQRPAQRARGGARLHPRHRRDAPTLADGRGARRGRPGRRGREPRACTRSCCAAHRQGGHRPVQARRRGAERPGGRSCWRRSSRRGQEAPGGGAVTERYHRMAHDLAEAAGRD